MARLFLVAPALLLAGCPSSTQHRTTDPADPPAVEAFSVPGACVDPLLDASERMGGPIFDPRWAESDGPDVDGDGIADRVVTARAPSDEIVIIHASVYVVRGDCGHFVGDVGRPPRADPSGARHHGLVDLVVAETSGCEPSGCEPGEVWYRFDGTVYARDEAGSRPSTLTARP